MPDGISYNHETVVLDDETFSSCEFTDCKLVYSGGQPPVFKSCKFNACVWKFEDSAARTLAHMKHLWDIGAKPSIQAMIKDITTAR